MAEASTPAAAGNTVPNKGDHDRIAMLSLKADGSPDQHNPEFIGDKESALEASRRQFTEQAVSAVDTAERAAAPPTVEVVDDAETAALRAKHDRAARSAESAADKAVSTLTKDA